MSNPSETLTHTTKSDRLHDLASLILIIIAITASIVGTISLLIHLALTYGTLAITTTLTIILGLTTLAAAQHNRSK